MRFEMLGVVVTGHRLLQVSKPRAVQSPILQTVVLIIVYTLSRHQVRLRLLRHQKMLMLSTLSLLAVAAAVVQDTIIQKVEAAVLVDCFIRHW